MAQLKAGARLKSAVCATEVIVIAAPAGGADVQCGGAAMLAAGEQAPAGAALDPGASDRHDARQALRQPARRPRAPLHQAGQRLASPSPAARARPEGSEAAAVVGLRSAGTTGRRTS